MKRKRIVKWVNAGLVICMSMTSFAGCKNKTVDYDIDEVTESSESARKVYGDGETGLKQFADVIADNPFWKEAGKVMLSDGNEYWWEVDAEISIPEAEQMYVAEVEESFFDAAEKERITDKLFGDMIYYYDTAHLPKKDLTERQSRYQKEYDAASETSERRGQLEEKLSECEEAMKTAGDVYIPVEEYDVDEYLGEREGIFYELSFQEEETLRFNHGRVLDVGDTYGRGRSVTLVPKDIYQVCPEEVSTVENLYYEVEDMDVSLENQCALSEEEAQKLAQSFVEGLESDYSVCIKSHPLYWYSGAGYANLELNYIADGYVFYYDAGIEDVSFVQYGTQEEFYFRKNDDDLQENKEKKKEKASNATSYSMNARMEIYVNEKGIIGMKAENPIKILHVTDGVKLLPLETVMGIMREYITLNRDWSWTWFTPNELKLIYFRVRDEENPGHYCYIPTWRFASGSFHDERGNAEIISSMLLINAMDGSVIDYSGDIGGKKQ